MGAPKGYRGETCAEAIWQHLMSCVVNLPPARRHWKSTEPFLIVHLDGRYELHDRSRHPIAVD